jgi:hypothetical protein
MKVKRIPFSVINVIMLLFFYCCLCYAIPDAVPAGSLAEDPAEPGLPSEPPSKLLQIAHLKNDMILGLRQCRRGVQLAVYAPVVDKVNVT